MTRLLVTASLIAILGGASAWGQAANPANMPAGTPETAPGIPAANQPNQPDRTFIQAAAIGGMAEVDLGKLAEGESQSAAVKSFGQLMIQDHTKANDQLTQLAQRASVPLPGGPDAESRTMHDQLMALHDGAFDRAYINSQIHAHQNTAQLLEYEIGSGQDAALQDFAAKTLPIVLWHLAIAQDIDAQLTGAAAPAAAMAEAPPPAANVPAGTTGNP